MTVRAIDNNHDFVFGQSKANYLSENLEIAQNVETRLLSWYDDCFFDTEAGIDWKNLGKEQTSIIQQIRYTILNTAGIVNINSFDYYIDEHRKLTVTANVDTLYSTNYQLRVEV